MAAYADEVGGDGEHRYILMCLVALEDPGLTVFPTHRLVNGLDAARREALDEALARDFEIEEVALEDLAPPPLGDQPTPLQMGYIDSVSQRPLRLTLKDQAIADTALAEHSEPYRHLDTGVLEALILKGALGMSDDDISHFNGMFYARDTDEAVAMVRSGSLRRGLRHAPHAGAPGARTRGRGREHAAQVHVLLSQAAHRAAVQPARVEGWSPHLSACRANIEYTEGSTDRRHRTWVSRKG